MLVSQTALEISGVRLFNGGVSGKFNGRTFYKAPCRHNDFAIIAGHIPRL